jgi:hypothetical protein
MTMTPFTAFRAWIVSVLVSGCAIAIWMFATQATFGHFDHLLHNVIDVTLGFGGIFAIVAAVVHVPVFVALSRLQREWLTEWRAVLIGTLLAPVTSMAITFTYRGSEDPGTLFAMLRQWLRYAPEVALGMLPFAVGGAVFGFVAVRPVRRRLS